MAPSTIATIEYICALLNPKQHDGLVRSSGNIAGRHSGNEAAVTTVAGAAGAVFMAAAMTGSGSDRSAGDSSVD